MKIKNESIMERFAPESLAELRKYCRLSTNDVEFRSDDFSGVRQEDVQKLQDTLAVLQLDHNSLVAEMNNNKEDSWNQARESLRKDLGEYCKHLSELLKPENICINPLPKETLEYELDCMGNPHHPKKPGTSKMNRDDPLSKEQRMEDWYRQFKGKQEQIEVTVGEYVRAWITGDHTEQTLRVMSTTGTGGVLIPTILSTRIIDLARNKTRVIQAGAATWPMESQTLTVPRQTGDASAGWRPELGHIKRTDVSFEPLVLKACSMGALITMSMELLEDAVGLDAFLTRTLSAVMAVGIDQAALSGKGEIDPNTKERVEPVGVLNTDNVQEIKLNADLKSYTPFSNAITKIRQVNGEPSGLMMAPVNFGILDALTATDGQPLMPPPSWSEVRHYDTNQVDEQTAIIGDWSQLAIGIRHNLRLEYATAGSIPKEGIHEELELFSQNAVAIRVLWRGDVGVQRPDHFIKITGINAEPEPDTEKTGRSKGKVA